MTQSTGRGGSTSSHGLPNRTRILEAVRDAALAITSELSLDDLLRRLVNLGRELVRARYGAIGVAKPDGSGLERFVVGGLSDEEIAAIGEWPRGRGLLGALLTEQRPIRIVNIAEDPRSVGFPPRHPPMKSFLGVPIIARGRILGSFYLADKLDTQVFTPEDEYLLVLFAAHAALSIDNARLFTQTDERLRQKLVELRRAEERSRFLAEFATLLPGPPASEIPLHEIAEKVGAILGGACAIRLFEPTKVLRHHNPPAVAPADSILDRLWPAIRIRITEARQAIFVPDASPAIAGPEAAALRESHCTGGIVFPLATPTSTYGVLATFSSGASGLTDDDLSFAKIVAERLASAIENVELHDQLASAIKAREEFVSIAAHELKTPVAVLHGSADILSADPEPDQPLRRKVVIAIARNAGRLARLTEQLLDEFRMQAGRLVFAYEEIDLVALVDEVVDRIRSQASAAAIEVRADPPQAVGTWDRGRLDQVITNLIDNAIKYSEPGAPVVVSIWQEGPEYRLSVRDRGIGIPDESQPHVLEAFFRAPNARLAYPQGTGLGLHLSSEILERLGGRLWFESRERQGTTFHVALPVGEGDCMRRRC